MPIPHTPPSSEPLVLLRLPEIERRVGFKRATIYRLIADPTSDFPRPVKLLGSLSAWPQHEIDAWIAARIVERGVAA